MDCTYICAIFFSIPQDAAGGVCERCGDQKPEAGVHFLFFL